MVALNTQLVNPGLQRVTTGSPLALALSRNNPTNTATPTTGISLQDIERADPLAVALLQRSLQPRRVSSIGQGLTQLGQAFVARNRLEQAKQTAAKAQERDRELLARVLRGEEGSLAEIAVVNPELASTAQSLISGQQQIRLGEQQLDRNRQATEDDTALRTLNLFNPDGSINSNALAEAQSIDPAFALNVSRLFAAEGEAQAQLAIARENLLRNHSQENLKTEAGIRKEFTNLTKNFREVNEAVSRVRTAAEAETAAGDLSLVFNFMKILDPQSVVRESEFRSAEQARAWLSRAQTSGIPVPAFIVQAIQKADKGPFLLPEQRQDFLQRANDLTRSQEALFEKLIVEFEERARNAGVRSGEVIVDPRVQDTNTIIPRGATSESLGISDLSNQSVNDILRITGVE